MYVRYLGSRNLVSLEFWLSVKDYPEIVQEILDFERKINEKIKEFKR